MFRLAKLSLGNRAVVALATIVVAIFGVVSLGALKQELIPSFETPQAAIVTTYPGASPQVIDSQVSSPLEDAVRQSGNMDTPAVGSSTIKVSAQELQAWQATLKSFFKAPVALKMNEKGEGEIKLSFKSKEELVAILNKVQ